MNKSLSLLCRPPAILAVVLVVVNDWLLKPLFPSWLTGKLSDIGVLFFLPLLAGGLITLALPRNWRGREAWAAGTGYLLTLCGYLLLKAAPVTATWLANSISNLTGFQLRALADPTDLWLLPVLGLSAGWWALAGRKPLPGLLRRWLFVPLVALVALADAAMPDPGIACLREADGVLFARGGYSRTYASTDGGMTWAEKGESWQGNCGLLEETDRREVALPDGSVTYRIQRGGAVERSSDGGATWRPVGASAEIREAEQAYILKTRGSNLDFIMPPQDALVDPAGGNLILAMGQQGVLVVRPDGSWQWSGVGSYQHESLRTAGLNGYLLLLTSEMVLALEAGLVWLGTAVLAGRRRAWTVVSVLAWLGVFFTGAALHPEVANEAYIGIVPVFGLLVCALLSVVLVIGAAVAIKANLLRGLPLALLLAVLALVPYGLWALDVLPRYGMAQLLAGGLVLGTYLILGDRVGKRIKSTGR